MFKHRTIDNFWNLKFLTKYLETTDAFIAGGCFKNILDGELVKDIDVYFKNEAAFLDTKDWLDYKCLQEDGKPEFTKSYTNERVVAFNHLESGIRIELIRSVFGEPEDVINMFDFTVTKFALYIDPLNNIKIVHHEDYFEHLKQKRLVIDNEIPFPVSTFERTYKYRDYGYKLCRESKIKLLTAIITLNVISDEAISAGLYAGLD